MDKKSYEIINQFDWDFIGKSIFKLSDDTKKSIIEIIESEKDKIEKRLILIKRLGIQKLLCKYWIFVYNLDVNNPIIRAYFIPYSYMLKLDVNSSDILLPAYNENEEWDYLHTLLQEYSTLQEFEKCQIIKERLEQIINEQP